MSASANPDITSGMNVLVRLKNAPAAIKTVFRGQEGATVYFDFGPCDLHDIDLIAPDFEINKETDQ